MKATYGTPFQDSFAALAAFKAAQRILIVAHQKPDGDTTGSSLALRHWLASMGKDVSVFCRHNVAEQFLYLAQAHDVQTDPAVFSQPWDMLVTCDSGDLVYAGIDSYLKSMPGKPVMVNFDHHASNQYFGDYNLVDVHASSTAEVVARFLREHKQTITKDMATCLLTAIFTDTNGFTNAATTQTSLELAGEFMAAGASLPHVHRATMVNKNIAMMKVWGKVMQRLQRSHHGIVFTYVHQRDLDADGVNSEAIEGISNYLSQLSDARAVMLFHDRGDGFVKASLRTIHDDIDLAAFATKFGGGGHKKASGFTVKGTLVEECGKLRICPQDLH